MTARTWGKVALATTVIVAVTVGLVNVDPTHPARPPQQVEKLGAAGSGIQKIKHVIVIMQENRSFDDYFGTFPGADGIPRANGVPTVCNPNSITGGCDKPY